jgi:hypothetical protein
MGPSSPTRFTAFSRESPKWFTFCLLSQESSLPIIDRIGRSASIIRTGTQSSDGVSTKSLKTRYFGTLSLLGVADQDEAGPEEWVGGTGLLASPVQRL